MEQTDKVVSLLDSLAGLIRLVTFWRLKLYFRRVDWNADSSVINFICLCCICSQKMSSLFPETTLIFEDESSAGTVSSDGSDRQSQRKCASLCYPAFSIIFGFIFYSASPDGTEKLANTKNVFRRNLLLWNTKHNLY